MIVFKQSLKISKEIYKSNSPSQTQKIAAGLAAKIKSGVIALTGSLGAGKTTFTQGFAKGLGITEKVASPTFMLIRQHPIPKLEKNLYHIDLYRLEDPIDIKSLGIEEIINNPENLSLIEWAEKIKDQLPQNTIFVNIKIIAGEKRVIEVESGLV
ncbi:MAG: tRNA (adenosine(37)-N6)-threonylcarbamoyltransferase complex ATPase subunit type 1 TsaE [Candidatus Daviesbacteria bacterium]|nr:MAG: tRNA (adenosine(37)-N6)-threonylcarbamoyltransferase complex ATPase subunit type 1 TsaE [Candidatus Daviesbacteria bacterium]